MNRGREGLILLAVVFLLGSAASKKVVRQSDLVALARRVGFRDPDLAAAIALAESGGNASAIGDLLRGTSVGLWQINLRAHPEYTYGALLDADNNARAALAISKGGTDWTPWTTYKTGAYKRFLPQGRAA